MSAQFKPSHSNWRRQRAERGGVLIQGVIFTIALVAFVVCAAFFVLNSGLSFYYKQKLQLVALNAAHYAGSLSGSDREAKVVERVNSLLNRMGLPNASEVSITAPGQPVRVSVKVDRLPLLGDGSIVPASLSLEETQGAQLFNNAEAYLRLEFDDNFSPPAGLPMIRGGAYVPVLRASQIDPALPVFMLDTNEWPATQVVYHRVYSNFPNYR